MKILRKLVCFFRGHKFKEVEPLPPNACLTVCTRCKGEYAVKLRGEHAGHYVPWDEVTKQVYTLASRKLKEEKTDGS